MAEFETIQVGKNSGRDLFADLYLPDQDNAPLIVAASGGGWRRGHRKALAQWGRYFSAQGFAFASVDYARAENGPAFPTNVQDIAIALDYFSTSGAEHGTSQTELGVLGVSAGAHLSALALLSPQFETPKVKCLATIYGVYDLLPHWQKDLGQCAGGDHNLTQRMLGKTPFEDPDLYHAASPLRQIRSADKMPVFIAWGDKDREILPSQSEQFATALQQAGYPVRVCEVAGAGHFWFSEDDVNQSGSHAHTVAPHLSTFFARNLKS